MAVINKYTPHTIEPDILSRLNVDQAGDVVSAETWVALWELVLHLLSKYNEHFVDIYRTLEELGTEVDTCIKRIDTLEVQYHDLENRMGNLEKSWSALQDTYNKIAGHYEEIKHIQESLESGFVHYGKEPPTTDFIKLWVMPTHGIPSLITSWGENDILATNYNYASAKLIKDSLNTKVNKAGDTMTGTLRFSGINYQAIYGGNPATSEWYVNWDGDFKLSSGRVANLDVGDIFRVGKAPYVFVVNTRVRDPFVSLSNLRLTDLKTPTMPEDAAPKQYVDDTRDINPIPSSIVNDWVYGRLYKTWSYDSDQVATSLQYRTGAGVLMDLPDEAQNIKGLVFKTRETVTTTNPDGSTSEYDNIIVTVFNGEEHCVVHIDRQTNSITIKNSLKPAKPNADGTYNPELLEPSHSIYPTTALVKEYVAPKIADLEENKFKHTPNVTVLNEVTVDTPEIDAYTVPYSLGLVEGTTYTVNYVTSSGVTGQFNIVAALNPDFGTPPNSLILTDSFDAPNVTVVDCCDLNWEFNASSSMFFPESQTMSDDPIVKITVHGLNTEVLTHDKLPLECLDIPDGFISRNKLKPAYTTYGVPIMTNVVRINETIIPNAKHIVIHGVLKILEKYENGTLNILYRDANDVVEENNIYCAINVAGEDLQSSYGIDFKIELRRVDNYYDTVAAATRTAYYIEITTQDSHNPSKTVNQTTCFDTTDYNKITELELWVCNSAAPAFTANMKQGSYVSIDVLEY